MKTSLPSCRQLTVGIILGVSIPVAADVQAPALVPPAKSVQWKSVSPLRLESDSVAIVVGARATAPERSAADMLQRYVARRFGTSWPVLAEDKGKPSQATIILLGQRVTNHWLDQLCEQRGIDLGPKSPGADGYVIEMFEVQGHTVILAGGSNARAVGYAQDTLFQLLAADEGGLSVRRASIRDWPTVPWRGRPQTQVVHHLQPGIMDCYVSSRVNFVDLRNGTYAFEPDYEFTEKDIADIAKAIKDAHDRGILVYGTVNCGVPRSQHDRVLAMFDKFVSFGVDGLWVSFDDRGPGEAPEEIVRRTLELAARYGIKDHLIATTPPKGSYQTIDVPFNRTIMAVPGMERALWFWTCLPSAKARDEARSIGLTVRPSWWHNWPRPNSGFTHIHNSGLHAEGGRSYMELSAMAKGWHEPPYELLAEAAPCVEAVMPWGGNAWHQYYIVPVIGWWGWDPKQHDWQAVRARIYDLVFGSSQVRDVMAFDDTLIEAKTLFTYPCRPAKWKIQTLPRLRRLDDRTRANDLLDQLEALRSKIERRATAETMLDPEPVQSRMLDAMQQEIVAGKAAAKLAYPEYWWDKHQRQILDSVYDGDMDRANRLTAEVRDRLIAEADAVSRALGFLKPTKVYASWWRRVAGMDGKGWQDLVAERRAELDRRISHYGYYSVLISSLIDEIHNVPYGRGRGGANQQWRVLDTVLPTQREQFNGAWLGGLFKQNATQAAVFALDPDADAQTGDYSELEVRVPITRARDRLGLVIYMNRWTKDKIGGEHVEGRWEGFAQAQLLWGDRILWQQDIGLPRDRHEWDLVRLPTVPDDVSELPLRLRVIHLKNADGMRPIVFVGPLRLVEMPE